MINFIKKYYLGAIALVMAIAFACVAIFVERSQNTTNLNAVTEDTVVEISSNSFNYTGIVDYIDDISTEKHDENTDIYYAQAKLCTSLAYLKGYDLTSDENEDVSVSSNTTIDVLAGTMDITLSLNSDSYSEEVGAIVYYDFDEYGNIIGTINVDGQECDLNELMTAISGTDNIEECFVLSFTAICIITGVVVGGTVGAIAGWNIAKAKKVKSGNRWKYVLGGVVIGATVGGLIGWGAGATATTLFPKLKTIGLTIGKTAKASTKVAKNIESFSSYNRFKNAFGKAKSYIKNGEWHHIVEQQTIKNCGNSATQIYNSGNTVAISKRLHTAISSYYSRSYMNGMTYRQYINTLPFDQQYSKGVDIMIKLAKELGENIVWICK